MTANDWIDQALARYGETLHMAVAQCLAERPESHDLVACLLCEGHETTLTLASRERVVQELREQSLGALASELERKPALPLGDVYLVLITPDRVLLSAIGQPDRGQA